LGGNRQNMCSSGTLLFFPRYGLGLTLARARVGMGALPTNRQLPAVTEPAIAAKIHQPLNMRCYIAAKVPFDDVVAVNRLANLQDFRVRQFEHAALGRNTDTGANFLGFSRANAVNILKRDDNPLVG